MMKADSTRPKPAHALQVERGMTRIIFEKAVLLIRQTLDPRSQPPVTGLKPRRGKVPQNSVDFPAAWLRRASSASASSFPAFTSRSIRRSHTAASNSANHRRNSASSSAERPETFFSRASSLLIEETLPLLLWRVTRLYPAPLEIEPPIVQGRKTSEVANGRRTAVRRSTTVDGESSRSTDNQPTEG